MVGVVLRFSSIASCADTRGVRVESPIRPFLTQQIASMERLWGGPRGFSHSFLLFASSVCPDFS